MCPDDFGESGAGDKVRDGSIVVIIQFISTHEISDVGCGCLSHANQFSDSPDAHQGSCNSVRF